jgi:hypothetical protein
MRAQNLTMFLLMVEGVDSATWPFLLRRHDYVRWFRDAIDAAAARCVQIEQMVHRHHVTPAEAQPLSFSIGAAGLEALIRPRFERLPTPVRGPGSTALGRARGPAWRKSAWDRR